MLSIEIFRSYRHLSVQQLAKEADINKQTYYNFLSGQNNISHSVVVNLDSALRLNGFLHITHIFDRLYRMGVRLQPDRIYFPGEYNEQFKDLMLKQHPIFDV
jgi:DNA-binding XRE family transcriptional regulator